MSHRNLGDWAGTLLLMAGLGAGVCGCSATAPSGQVNAGLMRADVNTDGQVDAIDTQLIVNVMLGLETHANLIAAADLTGDGVVDQLDSQALVNLSLGANR